MLCPVRDYLWVESKLIFYLCLSGTAYKYPEYILYLTAQVVHRYNSFLPIESLYGTGSIEAVNKNSMFPIYINDLVMRKRFREGER
ncbi:hypothetical protein DHB64_15070 [Antarcticibacterium sp. W02-3]|nr:hypothetical protein [Antarcticibacterium sp. W02-3]